MAKKKALSKVPKANDPVAVFKLLSDANRYRALALLGSARKGMLVGEIAESLDLEHSATSHLLGMLLETGVVNSRKEGRTVRYLIASTPFARRIMRAMRS